jgi:hypothetical protein
MGGSESGTDDCSNSARMLRVYYTRAVFHIGGGGRRSSRIFGVKRRLCAHVASERERERNAVWRSPEIRSVREILHSQAVRTP